MNDLVVELLDNLVGDILWFWNTFGWLLLVLGAGWVIFHIFYWLAETFGLFDPSEEENERWRRQEEERRRKEEADLSLTCHKCGGLAVPIRGTQNRYRCTCGSQFAAADHELI